MSGHGELDRHLYDDDIDRDEYEARCQETAYETSDRIFDGARALTAEQASRYGSPNRATCVICFEPESPTMPGFCPRHEPDERHTGIA